MSQWWAISMLLSGGLFVGGVALIAWERVPAWRATDLADFRTGFAHTLRRVDRLQPALLVVCLSSTIAFASSTGGAARTLAALAAGGFLVVLVGSVAWLVPLQRRLVASGRHRRRRTWRHCGPSGLAVTCSGAASRWPASSWPSSPPSCEDPDNHRVRMAWKEDSMLQLRELDDRVPLADQLSEEVGPVILINTFRVAPEDADTLLEAWAADAAYLKQQPGFISTQLHRGIAGSGMFLNHAVWESVQAFRNAFGDPQFQATFARYPDSTLASPHLFQKVAVPGICVDR